MIAFCGVCRPLQLDRDDVVLKKDNTYEVHHEISEVVYVFDDGENKREEIRGLMMERIDKESIGKSVYEFYNVFPVSDKDKGKTIDVSLYVRNDKGRRSNNVKNVKIRVL